LWESWWNSNQTRPSPYITSYIILILYFQNISKLVSYYSINIIINHNCKFNDLVLTFICIVHDLSLSDKNQKTKNSELQTNWRTHLGRIRFVNYCTSVRNSIISHDEDVHIPTTTKTVKTVNPFARVYYIKRIYIYNIYNIIFTGISRIHAGGGVAPFRLCFRVFWKVVDVSNRLQYKCARTMSYIIILLYVILFWELHACVPRSVVDWGRGGVRGPRKCLEFSVLWACTVLTVVRFSGKTKRRDSAR